MTFEQLHLFNTFCLDNLVWVDIKLFLRNACLFEFSLLKFTRNKFVGRFVFWLILIQLFQNRYDLSENFFFLFPNSNLLLTISNWNLHSLCRNTPTLCIYFISTTRGRADVWVANSFPFLLQLRVTFLNGWKTVNRIGRMMNPGDLGWVDHLCN